MKILKTKFEEEKSANSVSEKFSSFILHQNLVANKHAIFYRFDQRKSVSRLLII
jgi:hypothetical protein